MSDWSSGYVTDVGYTFGYYLELNPARVGFSLLHAGVRPPKIATACELGFGQGLSVSVHSAAAPVAWHGTDFNPAQAGFARELAAASKTTANLTDEAFADFAARTDLPDFDFIGLHGIWSWISDDNRRVIVDFVRRKLTVGGVLYVSYNTLPGWAATMPLRHLLVEHAEAMAPASLGSVGRIDASIAFAERLVATNPAAVRANPAITQRLQAIKGQNRHYLAHEYFNRDWHPMPFADMARWLAPAKIEFAASAHYLDQLEAINLTADQQALLRELPDPRFRQSVRDYCVNQQFRRDYWIKGARRVTGVEQAELLRRQRVVLTTRSANVTLKATGGLGEANLVEAVYRPVLEALSDHAIRTLGDIETAVKSQNVNFAQVVQAVLVLIGKGDCAPVGPDAPTAASIQACGRLNAHLVDLARGSSDIGCLASPVTGGGVGVDRFAQLFLAAHAAGLRDADNLARAAWQHIEAQGQRLLKDGKTLDTPDANLAELRERATTFLTVQLPILQALQVSPAPEARPS